MKTIAERFWSKVVKRGEYDCWNWIAAKTDKGYGRIIVRGINRFAHRVAFELEHGSIPDGLCVLHRCDNPSCVNAGHLFLGTSDDNAKDMAAKGRARNGRLRGDSHGMAKLTAVDVVKIRRAHKAGVINQRLVAQQYGVTDSNIWCIVNRRSWRHIE